MRPYKARCVSLLTRWQAIVYLTVLANNSMKFGFLLTLVDDARINTHKNVKTRCCMKDAAFCEMTMIDNKPIPENLVVVC